MLGNWVLLLGYMKLGVQTLAAYKSRILNTACAAAKFGGQVILVAVYTKPFLLQVKHKAVRHLCGRLRLRYGPDSGSGYGASMPCRYASAARRQGQTGGTKVAGGDRGYAHGLTSQFG